MIRRNDIKQYVKALTREFAPKRVVLFGSYAKGHPTVDSDVDLLVVMDHSGDAVDQALQIRRRIPRAFPLDLLVQSHAEMQRRLARKDMFFVSIMRAGRVLYER